MVVVYTANFKDLKKKMKLKSKEITETSDRNMFSWPILHKDLLLDAMSEEPVVYFVNFS